MKMLKRFKAARNSGAPLAGIQSADPQRTMVAIYNQVVLQSDPKKPYVQADGTEINLATAPVVQWDLIRGVKAWNAAGGQMLAALVDGMANEKGELDEATTQRVKDETANNPVNCLEFATKFWPCTIFFFLNAHRHLTEPGVAQAVWNLRDDYKRNMRMWIALSPDLPIPSELKDDIVIIDEPLPDDKELEAIILKTYKSAGVKQPEENILLKAVDAIAGLSAFPAETSTAMALTRDGVDLEILGEQRRQQVKGIPGASLYAGKEKFSDIVGCKNIVSFYNSLLKNPKERVRLLFFLDELEKMVAGVGDTSGVSQAMNEAFLTWSQNSRALGIILVGVPGSGKSLSAKCAGGEFDIPVLMASLSGVKGSHVGESEANVRNLFKTADAIAAGGRILMVATCNQIAALTPEMQARFRLGTWMFDFADESERAALWAFYKKRHGITDKEIPESINWVGREIEACCEMAYLTNSSLKDAAKRIVPVCRAKRDEIEQLKISCSGKFVSANYDGIFEYNSRKQTAPLAGQNTGRAVSLV